MQHSRFKDKISSKIK